MVPPREEGSTYGGSKLQSSLTLIGIAEKKIIFFRDEQRQDKEQQLWIAGGDIPVIHKDLIFLQMSETHRLWQFHLGGLEKLTAQDP